MAALVRVGDLERLEEGRELVGPNHRPRGALALVVAWEGLIEDGEIDAMLEDIYSAREHDPGRQVDFDA